ncbi:MAG: TVP38/TMEM64 family protein [Elusimicrobia bacterium]|nr:TVP38/TMEM64 family protein [Elusimicrobiota bacterium]
MQDIFKNSLIWIQSLGPGAGIAFILLYILACVFFIPGFILTLGAGAIFGLFWGFLYVSTAATLGATTAFLIGRYLARDWVSKKIGNYPRFKAIDEAIKQGGWKVVGLTRLSPLIPFNLLNYALGITQVSLKEYFFASWLGMLPGTVMYVYIGSLIGDIAKLDIENHVRTPAEWGLTILGLAATITVTLYITRLAKKAL